MLWFDNSSGEETWLAKFKPIPFYFVFEYFSITTRQENKTTKLQNCRLLKSDQLTNVTPTIFTTNLHDNLMFLCGSIQHVCVLCLKASQSLNGLCPGVCPATNLLELCHVESSCMDKMNAHHQSAVQCSARPISMTNLHHPEQCTPNYHVMCLVCVLPSNCLSSMSRRQFMQIRGMDKMNTHHQSARPICMKSQRFCRWSLQHVCVLKQIKRNVFHLLPWNSARSSPELLWLSMFSKNCEICDQKNTLFFSVGRSLGWRTWVFVCQQNFHFLYIHGCFRVLSKVPSLVLSREAFRIKKSQNCRPFP